MEKSYNTGGAIVTGAGQGAHQAPLGLRTVAMFELIKGVLFTLLALGAGSLVHKDVGLAAFDVVHKLHLDPAWHFSRLFIEASSKLNDTRLRLVVLFASGLAALRFAESYGLWHERAWAEWFAVISAGIYLPWEIYRFYREPRLAGALLFLVNVLIVVYLAGLLAENRRRKKAARAATGK
jgi:uncharacterized membrane protein (DUF2068 family)